MQRQFQLVTTGQEVQVADLNSIAESAALSEDQVFAELFRIQPFDGSDAYKGIVPKTAGTRVYASVESSGAADASINIPIFRALVGTRTLYGESSEVRSVIVDNGAGRDNTLQFTATAANNRWDVVYCRIDIDPYETAVTRYVKAADGTQGPQSLSVFKKTTGVVGILAGTESATPVRPSLPADGGGVYYIPLAYVSHTHPFTLTSTILPSEIDESACPVLGVAPAAGGSDVRPANFTNNVFEAVMAQWTVGAGRPREYLPPTMVGGKVERFFALDFTGGHASLTLGGLSAIDDTIDWRNRYFKCTVMVGSGGLAHTLPAAPMPAGNSPALVYTFMGQSFVVDTYDTVTAGQQGHVCILNSATVGIAASSNIEIYVASTGGMYAKCAVTSPASILFLWIEATGKFVNV